MFPQHIFLASPPSQYQHQLQTLLKSSRFQHNITQTHSKQITQMNMDERYVDSPLTQKSLEQIDRIRKDLVRYDGLFDTVVVAPLRKCMQTGWKVGGEHVEGKGQRKGGIQFFVEPLLADRLDSTQAIGDLSQSKHPQQYKQYSQLYQQFPQTIPQSQWIPSILPQRTLKCLPPSPTPQQYISLLHESPLQTPQQFSLRMHSLKASLMDYQKISGSNKKLLIIASAQVLNHLGATDFQEDGQPVNALRLAPGESDLVSLVVDGWDTIRMIDGESVLPFCR